MKQTLAVDRELNADWSLAQILQKIFLGLSDALPQAWVNFAADVSDVWALRIGFVGESARFFLERKDALERFLNIRPLYALTLLRDLMKLKKTLLDSSVNFLVTALQVDVTNSQKLSLARFEAERAKAEGGGAQPEAASEAVGVAAKPHPVVALIPGFDVLQSTLSESILCSNNLRT